MRHVLPRISHCEAIDEWRMNMISGRTLNPGLESPSPLRMKNDSGSEAGTVASEENIEGHCCAVRCRIKLRLGQANGSAPGHCIC